MDRDKLFTSTALQGYKTDEAVVANWREHQCLSALKPYNHPESAPTVPDVVEVDVFGFGNGVTQ